MARRRLFALGRSSPSVPAAGSQPQTEQARAGNARTAEIESAATKTTARTRMMNSSHARCGDAERPPDPAIRRAAVAWGLQGREQERAEVPRPPAKLAFRPGPSRRRV